MSGSLASIPQDEEAETLPLRLDPRKPFPDRSLPALLVVEAYRFLPPLSIRFAVRADHEAPQVTGSSVFVTEELLCLFTQ